MRLHALYAHTYVPFAVIHRVDNTPVGSVCRGLPAGVFEGGPQGPSARARDMAKDEPCHAAIIIDLGCQVQHSLP